MMEDYQIWNLIINMKSNGQRKISSKISNANILDFGSGDCKVVIAGRKMNLNFFGADTFYDGMESNIPDHLNSIGFYGSIVKRIENDSTGFPDAFFDLVLSNMVFEHVKDLKTVMKEISRIVKTNGKLIALFPHKEIFLEGHLVVPFIHWFSKTNIIRIPYLKTIGAVFKILVLFDPFLKKWCYKFLFQKSELSELVTE